MLPLTSEWKPLEEHLAPLGLWGQAAGFSWDLVRWVPAPLHMGACALCRGYSHKAYVPVSLLLKLWCVFPGNPFHHQASGSIWKIKRLTLRSCSSGDLNLGPPLNHLPVCSSLVPASPRAESGTVSPNPLKSAKNTQAALLARSTAWGPKGGAPGEAGPKPRGAAWPAQECPIQPMSARGRGIPASAIRRCCSRGRGAEVGVPSAGVRCPSCRELQPRGAREL